LNPVKSQFPSPQEWISSNRPSFLHRCRVQAAYLGNSNVVRFALWFSLFTLAGALMILLLEAGEKETSFTNLFQALWFTVVTITTVGYGDISPSGPLSQTWAMVEMLVGIGLVGVITGSVASVLVEGNRKRALGLAPIKHIRNHIVVCGWKKDIRNILLGILAANRWLIARDLVVVTTRSPGEVEELTRDRRLRGVHFVFGSHTDRTVLEMARVHEARRVVILADESALGKRRDPDSTTVLSAAVVEAVNPVVYTCTEIVHPHFIPYLKPAGVEEVVLGEKNAREILSAGSLGDGIGNVITCFLPEFGEQLRVMPIPPLLIRAPYAELARQLAAQGYMAIGLLENTGKLHDRKQEKIREALRQPDYAGSVEALRKVENLTSNVPRFSPPPGYTTGEHSKILVLLPSARTQSSEEARRRSGQIPEKRRSGPEHLFICGWKSDMASLLENILENHRAVGRRLAKVTVVARLPAGEREQISSRRALRQKVKVIEGEPTDPNVLKGAGIAKATRALILTAPDSERLNEEADARNLMICYAVNELNPATYKCVELFSPSFVEHLRIANVEETLYTQQYQRMMLVQASLGTGLSSSVGRLFDPTGPVLRVTHFPELEPGLSFSDYQRHFTGMGQQLIGLIEHSGNDHFRKKKYLYQAQSQPRIREGIERLVQIKHIHSNEAVLNPPGDFIPGIHSRAVVILSGREDEPSG
jgi:voltage-gated potassium channel